MAPIRGGASCAAHCGAHNNTTRLYQWAVGRRYMTMMTLLSPPGSELTSGKEVLLQAAG